MDRRLYFYDRFGSAKRIRRRNVLPSYMTFAHPNEFMVYSQSATDFGLPNLVCPHCGRKVQKVFTLAHEGDVGRQEAEFKFTRGAGNEVMCGFDLASLLADNDAIVLGEKVKK